MIRVPNAASYAAMHFLRELLGRRYGGSTGTNLYGTFGLIAEMRAQGVAGSVVTLICDAGELYADTYYNPAWLAAQGHDLAPYTRQLEQFYAGGDWAPPAP